MNHIRSRLVEEAKRVRSQATPGVRGVDWERPEDAVLINDLESYPHAFVIGCVMDRQVPAERAWGIPARIRERLGSFEFPHLAALRLPDAVQLFRSPSPLHRFPEQMAGHFHSAIRRISEDWGGDAGSIWTGGIGSATLVRRFLAFDGVGPKIATMAANILVRDFQIELSDQHFIDISVDVHVKRVFQRLGIVGKGASHEEIIYAAREITPDYPGLVDFSCWEIGRTWCHASKPICPECVMADVCPEARQFHGDREHPGGAE